MTVANAAVAGALACTEDTVHVEVESVGVDPAESEPADDPPAVYQRMLTATARGDAAARNQACARYALPGVTANPAVVLVMCRANMVPAAAEVSARLPVPVRACAEEAATDELPEVAHVPIPPSKV